MPLVRLRSINASQIMSASLLGLPGELRNAIYTSYIASVPHPQALILHGSEPAQLAPPPLSHACQQIRAEFLPLWKEVNIFKATKLHVLVENLDFTPLLAFLFAQGPRSRHRIEDVKITFRFTNASQIAQHGRTAARSWSQLDFTRVSGIYRHTRSFITTRPQRTRLPPKMHCYAALDWTGLGGEPKDARQASLSRRVGFEATERSLDKILRRAGEVGSRGAEGRRAEERAFRTWLRMELHDGPAARGK